MPSTYNHSPFSGIRDASQNNSPRRLDVGKYVLKVDGLRYFKSSKDQAPIFAADLEVVESSVPDFQPGDKVGYSTKMSKFPQYFLANIKHFLSAAGPASEDEIDEDIADMAVSPQQPLRGHIVRCIVTPNPKNEAFPEHRFLPQNDD